MTTERAGPNDVSVVRPLPDEQTDPGIILGFVGDMLVDRPHPSELLADVSGVLAAVDIRFANLEGLYADDPEELQGPSASLIAPLQNINLFAEAGFDVVSLANNHSLDGGAAVLLSNINLLRAAGVGVCGVGENSSAARAPTILEVRGRRFAYLAYSSVFPMGWEASENRAGLAPLRAYNTYHEPLPGFHFPGVIPRIETTPDEEDLKALAGDIAAAKAAGCIVVVSVHWGDYQRPYHLTDHEIRSARACIDHGADIVIGHHHHAIRGMEWYNGKPIIYGLGHFGFDWRMRYVTEEYKATFPNPVTDNYYGIAPREGWPLLPMHPDTRMTMMAWATLRDWEITSIGFIPCRMRPDGTVYPVSPASDEGAEVLRYFSACCTTQHLNASIVQDDDFRLAGFPTIRVLPNSTGVAA